MLSDLSTTGASTIIYTLCMVLKETVSFVFPGVLMFPKTLSQDTFEFDQGHVTKNQPIIVLILLSESLGI